VARWCSKIRGTENLNFAIPINYLRGLIEGPLSAISLEEVRAKLAKKTDVFQQADGFPSKWKSLTSGTTKVVRRDGERIYVETVLSDAAKQAGCFTLAESKKYGETFIGTVRQSCVCQYFDRWRSVTKTNHFSSETAFEITAISPTRIEGWAMNAPKDSQFDCAKGTYSKPLAREPFVWIPE
jgi:hypothetical protein